MPSTRLQVAWVHATDAVQTVMSLNQSTLDESFSLMLIKAKKSIWLDTLVFPTYLAGVSAVILLLHIILHSRPINKLYARLFPSRASVEEDHIIEPHGIQPASLFAEVKEHISKCGGSIIFLNRVMRLVGTLALLSLSVTTLVLETSNTDEKKYGAQDFDATGKHHWGKKHKHKGSQGFTRAEWLQVATSVTFAYASLLALVSVSAKPKWSRLTTTHLSFLLFFTFGIYFYRDIWPMATFTMSPKDTSEGWLLWSKIIVLAIVGVVIPLTIPRQYIPVDPKEYIEPCPEQTASIGSMMFFGFLDKIVFLAYRIPQLTHDDLPPLADYDYAKNLKKRSFPHIDPFTSNRKGHIFWGLMRIFRTEYIILALTIVVQAFGAFSQPLGVYQLLTYIEHKGEGVVVRPWAWIIWLFIGPFISSLAFQWYIFVATGTLVRTEGIITQLIFEHALRIRMKAEVETTPSEAASTAPTTPDNASAVDPSEAPESSHGSGEETLQASSTSIKSTSSKGKQKAKSDKADEPKPAQPSPSSDNLVGKINNLVTTDLGNITEGRDFLFILIWIPLQITLCVAFLYVLLGWSAFVGLAVMVLLFPLPGYVAKLVQAAQEERMKKTDARVQVVTETMSVLRMIKLFGWEAKMDERIADKREEELMLIRKRRVLDLWNNALNYFIPIITMITTYATYTVIMKQDLSASRVFSSMTVFDMLRDQLHTVFWHVSSAIQAKVSLDRVNEFLKDTELLDCFSPGADSTVGTFAAPSVDVDKTIGFRNAVFSWSNQSDGSLTPSRRNFNLRIEDEVLFQRDRFNIVIGPTGSGKTSLLMALLGEMHFIPSGPDSWFNLPRAGGVAYAAQESWVQNETIRENILFGAEYDEARYKKVLYQCALERDIALFEAGDKTEVGEKGLTLSGGQKARITLARAVYSSAQILLLDDVLAALDVHTAKWVVDKCFKAGGLVEGRTVILVTHNVAMATPVAHFMVSMGTDGRIASQGSVSQVLAEDSHLKREIQQEEEVIEKAEENIDSSAPIGEEKAPDGKLILAEETAEGHVTWQALNLYFSGLGGQHSFLFWLAFVGGLLITDFISVMQTWYLGHWAAQYETHPSSEVSVSYYLTIYGILLLTGLVLFSGSYTAYTFGSLRASRVIHKKLVESVLGTTLRWLDTTPTSRVIARCTQDIRAVDGPVSQGLNMLIEMSSNMLLKLAAVVVLTPLFLIPGVVIFAMGGWIGQIYMKAQLAIKREMSNARSPVLGHFGAAIVGLTSIRAYGAQEAFKKESIYRIDRYTRTARTFYNLNRWVCIRIDALGGMFAAGLAAYLIYGRELPTAENTGFSLNMAVGFSSMILWWIRVLNDFEISGNSLERIEHYTTMEQEPKPTKKGEPPAYWPASGEITVEKLSARYSLDGPKVLQDVSFHIKSGERVGVVGRTGSGKSSLTLSLLRCIYTEGTVTYDGIATSDLNLNALRSNITIIPQVPELLSGTLRQNLDPFSQHDDATLNDGLRSAGLFALQSEEDDSKLTLDSAISSGGGNLSVGQRQILALARAMVRGSKLLILDEATSAIDYKTDAIIQKSLRNELGGDVTLLTVAHRLQTIMDSDKIMVLDAGRVVEFDSPSELLKNRKGLLRALVNESSDKDTLLAMAAGSTSKQ